MTRAGATLLTAAQYSLLLAAPALSALFGAAAACAWISLRIDERRDSSLHARRR